MTRLVGSELFKLRTTRTFYGLTLISLGLILVIVILVSALTDFQPDEEVLTDMLGAGFFMQAITLLLGILIVTSEFRHGTITPSLLVVPDRTKLTLVKLVAALAIGVIIGLLTALVISGVTALVLAIRGLDTGADFSTFLELVAGGALAAALYAGLGVGLGALIRNQVGAIIGVLVWLFVLEGLVGLIPGLDEIVPKYGLNGVRAGLTGAEDGGGGPDSLELLGQVPAGLVLAGYVAVFMVAGLCHDAPSRHHRLARCQTRRPMGGIPINIAEHVGRTPMVQFTRLAPDGGAEVFGKLEWFNPGGSVKDRIGVAMIEAAEREGRIEPGKTTIVEATSGNTGIALAFVCAAKGYDLVLTLPQGMSREREGLLRLYGAQVHVTESMGGMNEAVAAAQAMARDSDVFLPDQFSNPANPEAHRRTTGPELWEALDSKIDYLVAGVGTGGTITGAGSFLKERNTDLKVIAVEPASSPVLSGGRPGPAQDPGHRRRLRPAGAGPPPARRDHRRRRRGRDRDRPRRRPPRGRAVRDQLRRGAATRPSRSRRAPKRENKRIAVILPDNGERYVSTPFFAPEPAPTTTA